MKSKICVVVPTIRPERHAEFVKVWTPLFEKHHVTLITIWDGESLRVTVDGNDGLPEQEYSSWDVKGFESHRDLFCRFTDACRNLGFFVATDLDPDYILTMDDDVVPLTEEQGYWLTDFMTVDNLTAALDPIQAHLDVLNKRVPLSWMNTAHDTDLYLRGVPYGVRDEAPVMLSHGVWVGTPDFDGETQLRLETDAVLSCGGCNGTGYIEKTYHGMTTRIKCGCLPGQKFPHGVPHSLPYYVGPIPRGVLFPLCGMNVMIKAEALPYFYFAPMGPGTGIGKHLVEIDSMTGMALGDSKAIEPTLNRFSDIWMGVFLKREFDRLNWACYTGGSTVLHTRASDAKKNFEQEKLGREWNEWMWREESVESKSFWNNTDKEKVVSDYLISYADKRRRYADLIRKLQEAAK